VQLFAQSKTTLVGKGRDVPGCRTLTAEEGHPIVVEVSEHGRHVHRLDNNPVQTGGRPQISERVRSA
jgi:hypothetical protein